jgi:hypothetical protein
MSLRSTLMKHCSSYSQYISLAKWSLQYTELEDIEASSPMPTRRLRSWYVATQACCTYKLTCLQVLVSLRATLRYFQQPPQVLDRLFLPARGSAAMAHLDDSLAAIGYGLLWTHILFPGHASMFT